MVKYILFYITLLITILSAQSHNNFSLKTSNDITTSIIFNLDDIELEEKGEFTRVITSSKGETSVIGMPKLPKFSTLFMLDPKKTYDITFNIMSCFRNIK